MNEKNRLLNAGKIWAEIKVKKEERKGLNNDIAGFQKKVEEALIEKDGQPVNIDLLKKHYRQIKKLEGDRKDINAVINRLKASLENCIMGKGNYDVQQMTIDDYIEQVAKEEKDKKKKGAGPEIVKPPKPKIKR